MQPKTILLVLAAAMQEDMRRQRSAEEEGVNEGAVRDEGGDVTGAGKEVNGNGSAGNGGLSAVEASQRDRADDGEEPGNAELQAADRSNSSKRGIFGGWFKSGGR